jgi:hypothetical protein
MMARKGAAMTELTPPDTATRRAAEAIGAQLADGPITLAGVATPLPEAAAMALRAIINELANGNAVAVVGREEEFSPDEVAVTLHMPVDIVQRLMAEGRVAYRTVGTEPRIPASAITAFRASQRAAMDEMVRLDQEMGLYDFPESAVGAVNEPV